MAVSVCQSQDGGRETEGTTMTTYTGTQEVDPGLYLNLRKFRLASMERRGPLPGTTEETYRRMPMLMMLALAPVLGLVYVIFLPFIGFVAVAYLAGQKAVEAGARVAEQFGRVRQPGWAPTLAFLGRTRRAKNTPQETAHDAWKEDVEKKLNEDDSKAR